MREAKEQKIDPEKLQAKVENAPRLPGVYLMKDKHEKVIYVGKAKDLRNRIRAYFGLKDTRPMIPFLVSRIFDFDFIVTETEKEALILENNLIKEHRPRYNVYFRDDKDYLSLRIDLKDPFPRFELVRRPKKDGAAYFGPFASSTAMRETLHFVHRIFPLRTCKPLEFRSRKRPCIEYEIKRCLGPCCGLIPKEKYRELVEDSVAFMEGRGKSLVSDLKRRMNAAADAYRFEEAARLRDMIAAIEATIEKQRMLSVSNVNRDVFGLYREGNLAQVCILFVRKGKVLGSKKLSPIRLNVESAEIVSSVLKQYYQTEALIPEEILLPEEIEDREVIQEWLADKKGGRISLEIPRRGDKKALVDMARENAENVFKTDQLARENREDSLKLLARHLHLSKLPERIECFDISNIGGQYAVGSIVYFRGGLPEKSGYRRFRINTVRGMDDYGMMYEVLKRRYADRENLPDLLIVDGGKGQLNVALAVARELDLIGAMDIVGIAKEEREGNKPTLQKSSRLRKDEDRVYVAGRKDPIYLSRQPRELFLLMRVRDEAHRFAVAYHRKLKEKSDFRSVLDEIPGIGRGKKNALLAHFKDINTIRRASVEELKQVGGIGDELAGVIRRFFEAAPGAAPPEQKTRDRSEAGEDASGSEA